MLECVLVGEAVGSCDALAIKSINAFLITTPEQALKAYAGLRAASDLTVTVKRKGKPVTLDYHIR